MYPYNSKTKQTNCCAEISDFLMEYMHFADDGYMVKI